MILQKCNITSPTICLITLSSLSRGIGIDPLNALDVFKEKVVCNNPNYIITFDAASSYIVFFTVANGADVIINYHPFMLICVRMNFPRSILFWFARTPAPRRWIKYVFYQLITSQPSLYHLDESRGRELFVNIRDYPWKGPRCHDQVFTSQVGDRTSAHCRANARGHCPGSVPALDSRRRGGQRGNQLPEADERNIINHCATSTSEVAVAFPLILTYAREVSVSTRKPVNTNDRLTVKPDGVLVPESRPGTARSERSSVEGRVCDREVACSASDRQARILCLEGRAICFISPSSLMPYVHKGDII